MPQNNKLELLTVNVQHNVIPTRICISVFIAHQQMMFVSTMYLESINCVWFTNFLIIGDFNTDIQHVLTLSIQNLVALCLYIPCTRQLIYSSRAGSYLFKYTSLVNTDHNGLLAKLSLKSTCNVPKKHTIWRYQYAD